MLDLTAIPVIDQHCHPVLVQQNIDIAQFRRYFTEAADLHIAEQHVPHTVYYLWFIRQAAAFYGCAPTEEAVVAARNSVESASLLKRLWQDAHIAALVFDAAIPTPSLCYTPERMEEISQCRAVKLLRLETFMQELILASGDFDEVTQRFSEALSAVRENGYCGLKSIAAYRTGLDIREWSKDEAVAAFVEARAEAVAQGTLRINHKPVIDYLLHIAFGHAAQQRLPVQFHTGYGDSDTNMLLGNPLYLRPLLERREYWDMQVILLHESYPYTQLGAYLASVYPHVYFDLSYMIPFVDALEMQVFTRQALSVAPASKLVYSSDGINLPEMHWVAAARGRHMLGHALQEMIDAGEMDEAQALQLARLILHETSATLYKI